MIAYLVLLLHASSTAAVAAAATAAAATAAAVVGDLKSNFLRSCRATVLAQAYKERWTI